MLVPIQPIYRKNWAKWAELAVLFSWQLLNGPRIFIFSIAMGADYSFENISIENYAPQFIGNNKLILGCVGPLTMHVNSADQLGLSKFVQPCLNLLRLV